MARTNSWMDGWVDGWMGERMNERTNERTNERPNEWMHKWMHAQMNACTNEWKNKWVIAYLQDAIQGVEGQPSKGGQSVLLVVLVVDVVQHPAPPNIIQWYKHPQEICLSGKSKVCDIPNDVVICFVLWCIVIYCLQCWTLQSTL